MTRGQNIGLPNRDLQQWSSFMLEEIGRFPLERNPVAPQFQPIVDTNVLDKIIIFGVIIKRCD